MVPDGVEPSSPVCHTGALPLDDGTASRNTDLAGPGLVPVVTDGIEPSLPVCETGVLPIDDATEPAVVGAGFEPANNWPSTSRLCLFAYPTAHHKTARSPRLQAPVSIRESWPYEGQSGTSPACKETRSTQEHSPHLNECLTTTSHLSKQVTPKTGDTRNQ